MTAARPATSEACRRGRAGLPLFAYGTLRDGRLLRRLAGCDAGRPLPATLPGYAVRAVRGEPWPALVPEPGATASGVLWGPLPLSAWPRLDRYEGRWYRRVVLPVIAAGDAPSAAWVYVWQGPRTRVSRPWPARRGAAPVISRGAQR